MAFVQYQNGLINETQLRSMLAPVVTGLRGELGQQLWDGNPFLGSEFRNYVQENLVD